ncbi:MAG: rhomboid family intramembrane serine protease [Candidatus Lokiarchaeota archaeon]|nr:rhomboid family intramembrane serine protease [Candidatus Lokiarchaeota archaeon]
MVKCNYCGEPINYLPFKCNYCRKYYCKKHRLPENHECSLKYQKELLQDKNKRQQRTYTKKLPSQTGVYQISKSSSHSLFSGPFWNKLSNVKGITWVLTLNMIFLILSIIPPVQPYVYLSVGNMVRFPYLFYTIVTAMFIPATITSSFGFLILLIYFFFLFQNGRAIEKRFGKKTFLRIYLGGTLITSIVIFILQSLMLAIPGYQILADAGMYSSWGGMMAVIAFYSLLNPNAQMRLFLYFIPIRMTAKWILILFVGFELVPGVISLIDLFATPVAQVMYFNAGFIQYFANIAGVLSGYLIVRSMRGPSINMMR